MCLGAVLEHVPRDLSTYPCSNIEEERREGQKERGGEAQPCLLPAKRVLAPRQPPVQSAGAVPCVCPPVASFCGVRAAPPEASVLTASLGMRFHLCELTSCPH